jgi:hypothetical protein
LLGLVVGRHDLLLGLADGLACRGQLGLEVLADAAHVCARLSDQAPAQALGFVDAGGVGQIHDRRRQAGLGRRDRGLPVPELRQRQVGEVQALDVQLPAGLRIDDFGGHLGGGVLSDFHVLDSLLRQRIIQLVVGNATGI